MTMTWGTYKGVRKRLKCATALLQVVPGGYLAQFDSFHHREAYGWWFFPSKDFDILRDQK